MHQKVFNVLSLTLRPVFDSVCLFVGKWVRPLSLASMSIPQLQKPASMWKRKWIWLTTHSLPIVPSAGLGLELQKKLPHQSIPITFMFQNVSLFMHSSHGKSCCLWALHWLMLSIPSGSCASRASFEGFGDAEVEVKGLFSTLQLKIPKASSPVWNSRGNQTKIHLHKTSRILTKQPKQPENKRTSKLPKQNVPSFSIPCLFEKTNALSRRFGRATEPAANHRDQHLGALRKSRGKPWKKREGLVFSTVFYGVFVFLSLKMCLISKDDA